MKLYELTEAYKVLADMDQDDDVVSRALEATSEQFEAKAENVAKVVRTLEAEADAFAAEMHRLGSACTARADRVRALKWYLQQNMEALGKEKIKGQVLSLALQASPPSCEVLTEGLVPSEFKVLVTSTRIDRKGIILAWQRGEQVPGAVVIQGKHLRIRP